MLRGLVVVAAACSPVMGGVLLNGSFEEPQQAGPGRYNIGLLSDWEATGGFMLLEQGVNGVSNIEAHTGTQFVSMGHSGATGDRLEQSFATEVGLRYDVSFATRSIQGLQPQEVLAEVTSDTGSLLGSLLAVETTANDGWVVHAFSFVADGDGATIALTHTFGSSGANVVIDSVSVDLVPAPGTVALLGLGVALAARRRG